MLNPLPPLSPVHRPQPSLALRVPPSALSCSVGAGNGTLLEVTTTPCLNSRSETCQCPFFGQYCQTFKPSLLPPLSSSLQEVPSCEGLLPEAAYNSWPTTGRDVTFEELAALYNRSKRWMAGLEGKQQEGEGIMHRATWKGERWFIWEPRFGLGNSLRGFTSAFVYSLLSGRRLLRWHGGAHRKVGISLLVL